MPAFSKVLIHSLLTLGPGPHEGPHAASGVAAGPTVIADSDDSTSPLRIHGPGSNLADSTLLELTGNGYRFAELGAANNPSGWAGTLKVKSPAGEIIGYILLYTNR